MKKFLTVKILEHLAVCGTSLMVNALSAPYGRSLGQGLRGVERIMARCQHDFSAISKGTISNTLSRLKEHGLVKRSGSRKKAIWRITKAGRHHFKARDEFALPPYDGKMRLVMFDVPEKERRQRDWLRTQLLACEYSPFQKSVWIGTRPLPREFLDELRVRGISSYVHIVGLEGIERAQKA